MFDRNAYEHEPHPSFSQDPWKEIEEARAFNAAMAQRRKTGHFAMSPMAIDDFEIWIAKVAELMQDEHPDELRSLLGKR